MQQARVLAGTADVERNPVLSVLCAFRRRYVTDGTAAVTVSLSLFFCPLQPPLLLRSFCGGVPSGGGDSSTPERSGGVDESVRNTGVVDLEFGGGDGGGNNSGASLATAEAALAEAAAAAEASAAGGSGHVLDESTFTKMPWDVVLLMGGEPGRLLACVSCFGKPSSLCCVVQI